MSFLDPRTRGGTRLSCELGPSDSGAVLAPERKTSAGRATAYPPADAWGRVDHVDARSAGEDLPVADDVGHVDVALDAALLELHVVLREGASLVREDVLHLQTQGLAGWCWPGICSAFSERERKQFAASDPGRRVSYHCFPYERDFDRFYAKQTPFTRLNYEHGGPSILPDRAWLRRWRGGLCLTRRKVVLLFSGCEAQRI